MKFNGSLRKVSKVFQRCFKDVLRVFQGTWRGVPRDLQEAQMVCQGSLKAIQKYFKKSFNGVSRMF